MRWFICFIVLCIPLFGSAQDSSVEILGVTVSRGMTKSYLSSVLPGMSCSDLSAHHGPFAESCSISDGIPPQALMVKLSSKRGLLFARPRTGSFP